MLMHSHSRAIDGAFMCTMIFNFVHKDDLVSTMKMQVLRPHSTELVIRGSKEGSGPHFEILWHQSYCILTVLCEQFEGLAQTHWKGEIFLWTHVEPCDICIDA